MLELTPGLFEHQSSWSLANVKAPEVIFQDKQKDKTSVILDNFVAYDIWYDIG